MTRSLTVLFPFLPPVARVGAAGLLAATVVATALAWAGGLGGAGIVSGLRPVPLFAALTLTGGSIAAATLPRYAYRYLQAHDWHRADPNRDPSFLVVSAHLIFAVLQIVLISVTTGAPSGSILAGVSMLGAVLWTVHEALTARRIDELARQRKVPGMAENEPE
ncbi:hypothetical protein FXN61_23995 [Lentzea sp. PSKA42]|uniref:Uncharacterized protein n=1 Tax=Lentzea indica TaxID=2604800 RepID=A0ABX1FLS4_9PSEU|nr:hypothetical protein [Lentzea indica]NKE59705.1 hypothetical protein [Lentzea indica]